MEGSDSWLFGVAGAADSVLETVRDKGCGVEVDVDVADADDEDAGIVQVVVGSRGFNSPAAMRSAYSSCGRSPRSER